jgi:hypothetical protein
MFFPAYLENLKKIQFTEEKKFQTGYLQLFSFWTLIYITLSLQNGHFYNLSLAYRENWNFDLHLPYT